MMRTAAIFPGGDDACVTESHNLYPAWEALCFVSRFAVHTWCSSQLMVRI